MLPNISLKNMITTIMDHLQKINPDYIITLCIPPNSIYLKGELYGQSISYGNQTGADDRGFLIRDNAPEKLDRIITGEEE